MKKHSSKKTHGTVERSARIDSFDAAKRGFPRFLFARVGNKSVVLDCDYECVYMGRYEQEFVHLGYPHSAWHITLELARLNNGFGGSRVFWVCPCCGRRYRYLYFVSKMFVCRKCGHLNYAVQQHTKDALSYYDKGIKLASAKLGCCDISDAFEFGRRIPDKPTGMHWTTYYKILGRYMRYQDMYNRKTLAEIGRILGRLGG